MNKQNYGLTLMELLIGILIVGILILMGMPIYLNYMNKTYYADVIQQVEPYKVAVLSCYNSMGNFNDCQAGINGVPPNLNNSCNGTNSVKQITVGGGQNQITIRVVPCAKYQVKESDYYDLKPEEKSGMVIWTGSGFAVDKGYAPSK